LTKKEEELVLISKNEEDQIRKNNENIYALKKRINFFNSVRTNLLKYFSDKIPLILKEIENTKFNSKVIGPLFREIKLKDHKWYKPVSVILRKFLTNFIVFDKKDKERLFLIFKKYQENFTILLPSNQSNFLTKYEESKKFQTVLSVLDITQPVVVNQLIILANIEQIMLIEEREKAYSVIRSKPFNVDSAYTIDGDRIKMYGKSLTDYRERGTDRYFFENSVGKLEECKRELEKLEGLKFSN
jgi:hypothetical protein